MSFTVYPAIDLKGGQCVRLLRGDMATATVYGDDPAAKARAFRDAGFAWLHVVDLDGAVAGRSINEAAIRAILATVDIPIQLGGGIRDRAAIDAWLALGVARVVLGSAAVTDPELLRDACRAHPGRIAVGIDARNGLVATEGWARAADLSATDLARRAEDAGAAALIHTDIGRDGTLAGPNIEATVALAATVRLPVIISGGVGGPGDIVALRQATRTCPNLAGVIVGRALYTGAVSPTDLLAPAPGP